MGKDKVLDGSPVAWADTTMDTNGIDGVDIYNDHGIMSLRTFIEDIRWLGDTIEPPPTADVKDWETQR